MKFKLNPLTGEFDYTSESANKQKLNPLTGEFNLVEGDGPFSQIFNPLTGTFNLGTKGGGGIIAEVTGNGYINLTNAVANHLMELKAYGGTEQRNLSYTQLEYIQGSGTQYIDTGIKLNQNNTVEVKYCYHVESSALTSGRIFGARYTSAPRKSFSIGSNTGKASAGTFVFSQFGDNNVEALNKIVIGQRDTYKLSADGFYVNDIKQGDLPTATFETPFTVKLFAFEQATSSSATPSIGCGTGRCKEFKVLNGDTLVMDLIPARNTSNVIGMYDLVSGQFFANAGTGTFTAGPDVVPTPTAPIDIVSNNGALKVKDSELPVGYRRVLGYACNNNVLWQITNFHLRGSDTVRASFSVTAACNVFGCYQGADANDNYDLYVSITNGSKYLRYGNGTYLSYWSNDNLGERFDVVFTPTGTTGMPTDSTWTPMTFESANNLLLAATTLTGTSSKLKGNLYGNFVVDGRLKLIPCERLSDNSLGYYDTYSDTFFEPTGTPTSLGYDYTYTSEIYVDGTTETIWSHGKNLFNKSDIITGKFLNDTGAEIDQSSGYYSGHISVNASTEYTISQTGGQEVYLRILEYDATDTMVKLNKGTTSGTQTKTFTTGATTTYVIVSGGSKNNALDTIQLELGSTATTYEPYYNGGTATAEMLLKVGTYQDEQEILSGNIIRKVGIKVLDGTESWTKGTVSTLKYYYGGDTDLDSNAENELICNQFAVGTRNIPSVGKICVRQSRNGFLITPNDQTINTAAKFKQFLADQYNAGTPVIVVYPLNTPTTESVAGQTMHIPAGNSTIGVVQASIDNLPLYAKYLQSN